MKKYSISFVIIVLLLINLNCEQSVTPDPEEPDYILNTVTFNSEPQGFTVYINGKVTGAKTPDSLRSLNLGINTIRLTKEYYRDSIFTINIENHQRYDLFFDILANPQMRGAIQVNSTPPGANIFLNGDSIGQVTPYKITSLVPGQYEIFLTRADHWHFNYPLSVLSNTTPVVNAALDDTTVWVTYNEKYTGQPINNLNTIAIDANGYVWIGTVQNGIFRYDGNNWINYNMNNSGIIDNTIRHLAVEGNKIWISTPGGISVFDNGAFTNYNINNSPLPSDNIMKIYIHNGKKYIGTFTQGVVIFDDVNWQLININNSELPSNTIRSLAVDNNNNLWIGTYNGGLAKFNGTIWEVFTVDSTEGFLTNNIEALAVSPNGDLYIGFAPFDNRIGGHAIYNGTSFSFYVSRPANHITDIKFDATGTPWLGSFRNGLFKQNAVNNFTTFYELNSKLPNNNVSGIAFDELGNKWVSTFGGGLTKYKGN